MNVGAAITSESLHQDSTSSTLECFSHLPSYFPPTYHTIYYLKGAM